MKGKNWSTSKYFGMTKDEIKKQWDDNRDQAAAAGTKMHYDIECFYNNMEVKNDSVEYSYFNKFYDDYKQLEAHRTEWHPALGRTTSAYKSMVLAAVRSEFLAAY